MPCPRAGKSLKNRSQPRYPLNCWRRRNLFLAPRALRHSVGSVARLLGQRLQAGTRADQPVWIPRRGPVNKPFEPTPPQRRNFGKRLIQTRAAGVCGTAVSREDYAHLHSPHVRGLAYFPA